MSQGLPRVPICYFPDTGQPVPAVMTRDEAVRFLRLDQADTKNPGRTIDYYRSRGRLRAVQVGKHLTFYLTDLLDFIEVQREANPR